MPDLSAGVQVAWQFAGAEAVQSRHELIEPMHLFIGVCSVEKLLQPEAQQKLQIPSEALEALRAEWDGLTKAVRRVIE